MHKTLRYVHTDTNTHTNTHTKPSERVYLGDFYDYLLFAKCVLTGLYINVGDFFKKKNLFSSACYNDVQKLLSESETFF